MTIGTASIILRCVTSSLMTLLPYCCIAAEENQPASADPFVECIRSFSSEDHFSAIANKLPLASLGNISFSMLADQSKPTAVEQQEIAEWFDRRDACQKNTEHYHQTHWPLNLSSLRMKLPRTPRRLAWTSTIKRPHSVRPIDSFSD